jgi:predicted nuclease of predicted toxin-antitoxin system
MALAAANGYIVVNHDLNFRAILAATQGVAPSAAQVRAEDASPDVIGTKIAKALHQMQAELEAGALLSIDEKNQAPTTLATGKPGRKSVMVWEPEC